MQMTEEVKRSFTKQEGGLTPQEWGTLAFVLRTEKGKEALSSLSKDLAPEQLKVWKMKIYNYIKKLTLPPSLEWPQDKKTAYLERLHADPTSMLQKCLRWATEARATPKQPAQASVQPQIVSVSVVSVPQTKVPHPSPSWPPPFVVEDLDF